MRQPLAPSQSLVLLQGAGIESRDPRPSFWSLPSRSRLGS